mgnify:CR=1 FL=1|jgi:hypothetical protein
MYINPFVAGVLSAVSIGMAIFLITIIIVGTKK